MPSKKIFNYFPEHVNDDIIAQTEKMMLEGLGSEVTIESSHDLKKVRWRALEVVVNLVNITRLTKSTMMTDSDTDLLLPSSGRRDKAYHAALFLVSNRSQRFIRLYPPKGMREKDIWTLLERARNEQISKSFFDLVSQIQQSKSNFDPFLEIEKLFIPELFGSEALSYVSKNISCVTDKSKDHYIIDSLLAAAAVFGGHENPRSNEWLQQLIKMTYRKNNWPPRLQLSKETLQKMVSVEELFNGLDMAGLLRSVKDLSSIWPIIEKFGYEEKRNPLLQRIMIFPHTEGIPAETFIENFTIALKEQGANDSVFGSALIPIASIEDEHYKTRCFDLILQKFAKSSPQIIIPLATTLLKQMLDSRNFTQTFALISEIQKEVDMKKLESGPRARILTEIGNAFRYKMRYSKALSIYKDIRSLIGRDLKEYNVRVNEANISVVLRDKGELMDAKKILLDVLKYTEEGRERFDCLFRLGTVYLKNGEFESAQNFFDQARPLIKHAPIDDQIAAFYYTLIKNQQELGLHSDFKLLAEVNRSKLVSDRLKDISLATMASAVFSRFVNDQDPDVKKARGSIVDYMNDQNFGESMRLKAKIDPQSAAVWVDSLISAGKDELAKDVVNILLSEHKEDHTISMYAATKAAEIAAKKSDWQKVTNHILRANKEMISLVKSVGRKEDSLHIVDTFLTVRKLARYLYPTTSQSETDNVLTLIAELQSSLKLSADLASEYIPLSTEQQTESPVIALAKHWNIHDATSILQFLDTGDFQVPLITQFYNGNICVKRGDVICTNEAIDIGKKIAFKVENIAATDTRDPLKDIPSYISFQEYFKNNMDNLGLHSDKPLLIIPSPATLGIPFHHILPNCPISYFPSISIALALSIRAKKELNHPTVMGEVVCWKFNEDVGLLQALKDGSRYLKNICENNSLQYQSVSGTEATKQNAEKLIKKSSWIKLSCHGLTNANYGKFAFLLSDGTQDPPAIDDMLYRQELADRYLYLWEDVSKSKDFCKLVFSVACASGESSSTLGGEQIGMARSFFRSGALSYIAPLWPVGGEAQIFINTLINSCITRPDIPLITHVCNVRRSLHNKIPTYINYAFILYGYHGPLAKLNI